MNLLESTLAVLTRIKECLGLCIIHKLGLYYSISNYLRKAFLLIPIYGLNIQNRFVKSLSYRLIKLKDSNVFTIGRYTIYQLFWEKVPKSYKANKEKQFLLEKTLLFMIIVPLFIHAVSGSFEQSNGKFEHNFQFSGIMTLHNNRRIVFGVGFGCESQNVSLGRSYESMNISISDCFFSRSLELSDNGGVINVNGGSLSLSVNYSMFYECSCSLKGGAIYFKSIVSILKMICASRCSASSNYFGFFEVTQVNQVEYLSVSNCPHNRSGSVTFQLESGNQSVDNTNSSMNYAIQISGILIYKPSIFTSSHCTFSNNNVSNSKCISIVSSKGVSITSANIVHNNCPSYGVIYTGDNGIKSFYYCLFLNNANYLFNKVLGSIWVFNSFIDHSVALFSNGQIVSTITNNTFTKSSTYQIQYFDSLHCNADEPLPQRTNYPIRSLEETISKTNEETMRMTLERSYDPTIKETPHETPYRSHHEIICLNQIGNKREINQIFSFSIIHPIVILMIS